MLNINTEVIHQLATLVIYISLIITACAIASYIVIVKCFMKARIKYISKLTMEKRSISEQTMIWMEETSELAKAVSKAYRYGPVKSGEPELGKGLKDDLIEEIADVLVCIDQVKEYYKISDYSIRKMKSRKTKRSMIQLEKEIKKG